MKESILIKPKRILKAPEDKIFEILKKAKLTNKDWKQIKKERLEK